MHIIGRNLKKIRDEKGKEEFILLKADKNVAYGVVASILADIKSLEFKKVGMVTKQIEEKQ